MKDGLVGINSSYLRLVVRVEDGYFVDYHDQEWNYATPYVGQVQTVKGWENNAHML
jgi:hypothetical protein